jgi:hypothetical protein
MSYSGRVGLEDLVDVLSADGTWLLGSLQGLSTRCAEAVVTTWSDDNFDFSFQADLAFLVQLLGLSLLLLFLFLWVLPLVLTFSDLSLELAVEGHLDDLSDLLDGEWITDLSVFSLSVSEPAIVSSVARILGFEMVAWHQLVLLFKSCLLEHFVDLLERVNHWFLFVVEVVG